MRAENIYRVVLFGHRDFDGHRILDEQLYSLLQKILRAKDFVDIYIGRNGEFDIYAATVIKRVQNKMGKENNMLNCVLPYPHKDMLYYEGYYDSVIIPECIEHAHPKGAIVKRNRWMVEQADLIICYVERDAGGAYAALEYAKKLHKTIINLANK